MLLSTRGSPPIFIQYFELTNLVDLRQSFGVKARLVFEVLGEEFSLDLSAKIPADGCPVLERRDVAR